MGHFDNLYQQVRLALGVNSYYSPLTIFAERSVLLTVLGFVVALALSFRSSTAYERYSEGRKSDPVRKSLKLIVGTGHR
jgi:predicted membrane chloride channel (bestrophin family)